MTSAADLDLRLAIDHKKTINSDLNVAVGQPHANELAISRMSRINLPKIINFRRIDIKRKRTREDFHVINELL